MCRRIMKRSSKGMDPQNPSQEAKGKLSTSTQTRVYSVAWREVGRRQDIWVALDTQGLWQKFFSGKIEKIQRTKVQNYKRIV